MSAHRSSGHRDPRSAASRSSADAERAPSPEPSPDDGSPEIGRRTFLGGAILGASSLTLGCGLTGSTGSASAEAGEDLFAYLDRTSGGFDPEVYRRLLGAANPFKEGDQAEGVAAADDAERERARALLARTRIADLLANPVFEDEVWRYAASAVDPSVAQGIADWTVGELRDFLLTEDREAIGSILPGLDSDSIAFVVKLMSNDELVAVSRKIFHPLPGSRLGDEGYLSARIQPNSPTDHPEDIAWQVFDGWSYAVGDMLLGTNPVSSEPDSVAEIERALADLIETFELEDALPHCVLAHIDIQATIERNQPGTTALWFQSLAGVDEANRTFDISVKKMAAHAAERTGKYGLYFETGQGADATNGHGKGFDMVIHEARKYGFARALKRDVAAAQEAAGRAPEPWVHVNDVAGFIGPEIFRSREQLVRCCLEDTVMGKLHGLTIGLDICSTLHMEVDLDDLDWCIDQIMPANPAYLMALPTKNDPMLSYLTTGFQDHVRIREKHGYRVNDRMWSFFQEIGVVDEEGRPTERFGQPVWVYLEYRRRKGDTRPDQEILAEGRRKIASVQDRGLFIAESHGEEIWQLEPATEERLRFLYEDSKKCIWEELPTDFTAGIPAAVSVASRSKNREDYILHPPSGEELTEESVAEIERLRSERVVKHDVQLVVSDGLNVFSLTDDGHLPPFLDRLGAELEAAGFALAPEPIVVTGGRVRAGYRIGEILYGASDPTSQPAILHVIGERPGSGHHAFSVYITAPPASLWAEPGRADHNITRVVSGIADTALLPAAAAKETVKILGELVTGT